MVSQLISNFSLDKFGFVFAAVSYGFFLFLLSVTRVRNLTKTLLLLFSGCSVLWACFNVWSIAAPYTTAGYFVVENIRHTALLLFLFAALSHHEMTFNRFIRQHHCFVLLLGISSWTILSVFNLITANLIFTGSLAICVLQLALLEALYRRANTAQWQYKPLILGLAVSTLFDFFLLAESALFGHADNQFWAARGFVYTAMLPLLVISIRRIEAWGINVYISRDIVLQSSLVLGSGIYLSLLAVAGFYIRYIGGNWSSLIQIAFTVTGIAILGVLLFSNSIRRDLKVFIEKHFFANRFDYREKWLSLTTQLKSIDISRPDQYNHVLAAWLQAIGYNKGVLLQFTHSGEIKSLACIDRPELNQAERELITQYQQRFTQHNWVVDLLDRGDPFVRSLPSKASVHFQLMLPIRAAGTLWGLCLLDTAQPVKHRLNWELRDYIQVVSEQLSGYLLLIQTSQALAENAQFAAFSRMSAFVVHDLKNVKAQIDLVLKNGQKHRHNPEFIDDTFDTLAAMQQRLGNMLEQLMQKTTHAENSSLFSAREAIRQIISERCATKEPVPQLINDIDAMLSINKERFSNVLYHLLDNAQHATDATGSITIALQQINQQLRIIITDTGSGMSADFIANRLFRPFDTTKGNAGMGIGAYDALHFARQQGGDLNVISEIDEGTTFTLSLPLN